MINQVFNESKKRIDLPDILRGIALLGILIANIAIFSGNVNMEGMNQSSKIIQVFSSLTTDFSFNTIFSFLFGFGFIMFIDNARKKGANVFAVYCRRLFGLFLFGLFHAFFGWHGDVLMFYAFMGIFLYFFRNVRPRKLVKIAFSIVTILILLIITATIVGPNEFSSSDVSSMSEAIKATIYSSGSYAQIFNLNMKSIIDTFLGYCWIGMSLFPMYLLGAAASKSHFFQNLNEYTHLINKMTIKGLAYSIISLAPIGISELFHPTQNSSFIVENCMMLSGFFLSFFYVGIIIKIYNSGKCAYMFDLLRNIGVLSLSNYLMQTVFLMFFFYGFGLGMYGQISPFGTILISVGFFCLQLLIAKWWTKRFNYGIAEWCLRSITYLSIPKLRKETNLK